MAPAKDFTRPRKAVKKPATKPPPDPHRPLGATVDRQKFVAFCAESSATLLHLFDRLQSVLTVMGANDEWIDRDRLLDTSYLIEKACGNMATMPFRPEVDLPDPVEVITLASVAGRARA